MALNVKVGGRETNSFITVSEADSYIADLPDPEEDWRGLSVPEKEYRLKLAANLIGFLRYRGIKAYRGQRLAFPRTHQGNVKVIPPEVKEAQAFIAYSVIHRGLSNRPDSAAKKEQTNDINQLYLGGALMVSFSKGKAAPQDVLSKLVQSAQFPALVGLKYHTVQVRGIVPSGTEGLTQSTTTTTTA